MECLDYVRETLLKAEEASHGSFPVRVGLNCASPETHRALFYAREDSGEVFRALERVARGQAWRLTLFPREVQLHPLHTT